MYLNKYLLGVTPIWSQVYEVAVQHDARVKLLLQQPFRVSTLWSQAAWVHFWTNSCTY